LEKYNNKGKRRRAGIMKAGRKETKESRNRKI